MKIRLIDELNDNIQNALIIIDTDSTFGPPLTDLFYVKHPILSKSSAFRFQYGFMATYFRNAFFFRYIDYMIFHQFRPYMSDYIVKDEMQIHPVSNEFTFSDQANERQTDPEGYYQKRKSIFYPRDMTRLKQVKKEITNEYLGILNAIKSIFIKHQTDFKIIVSPLYDQNLLNKEDLLILYSIFGRDRVFDFSGTNKYTQDMKNYYETSHYTKEVGKDILITIYNN